MKKFRIKGRENQKNKEWFLKVFSRPKLVGKCKEFKYGVCFDVGCMVLEIKIEKDGKSFGLKGGKIEKMGSGFIKF